LGASIENAGAFGNDCNQSPLNDRFQFWEDGISVCHPRRIVRAIPLAGAGAYVFTKTDTGTTGGNPAQEVFTETIQSDGTAGSTGSGAPTSFNVNWHASTGGSTFVDANATISVLTFTSSELKLQVAITNDSNFTSARLTAVGFDVDPAVSNQTISGGSVFTHVSTSNFPSFQEVDICAYSGNKLRGRWEHGAD